MLLVATNEKGFRTEMKKVLAEKGDFCVMAETGQEVLDQVNQIYPDVIILDLYLKEPSGLEVLRRLRAQGYVGKVIVLAGHSVQTMIPEAFRLGALQIVGRPLHVHHVLGAVRVASDELVAEPVQLS